MHITPQIAWCRAAAWCLGVCLALWSGQAAATCGDWLRHPSEEFPGIVSVEETTTVPRNRPLLPVCRGVRCQQSPAVPTNDLTFAAIDRIAAAIAATADDFEGHFVGAERFGRRLSSHVHGDSYHLLIERPP